MMYLDEILLIANSVPKSPSAHETLSILQQIREVARAEKRELTGEGDTALFLLHKLMEHQQEDEKHRRNHAGFVWRISIAAMEVGETLPYLIQPPPDTYEGIIQWDKGLYIFAVREEPPDPPGPSGWTNYYQLRRLEKQPNGRWKRIS